MSTKVNAMNSRKISAETAAKMMVSSLVSGCRNVSLKVACAKITVNRKKIQMERATSAGVRLRLFLSRVDGRAGNISYRFWETGERRRRAGAKLTCGSVELLYASLQGIPNFWGRLAVCQKGSSVAN